MVARKIGTNIDLLKFEIQNAKAHLLGSNPGSLGGGDEGLFWYNSTTHRLLYWNGSGAELKATDTDLLGGQASSWHVARTNHTGSQLASTISDLASTVQAYALSAFAVPAADVSFNSKKITNLADPASTTSQDAATANWVTTQIGGLQTGMVMKGSVRAVVTTNVNLASPGTTLDGLTAASGEIFLLAGQSTGTQNGPYVFNGSGSAMTRATNWDTDAEAALGSFWVIREGSHADQLAILTNDTAITLGTSTPAWTYISATGASYVGGAGLTLTGSTFDVGAGTGITVNANDVAVDTSVVGRKVTGAIPSASTGIYTVSGAQVTVNHALGNLAADVSIHVGSSPPAGYTQGEAVWCYYVNSDANNSVITLPAAPGANQFVLSVVG